VSIESNYPREPGVTPRKESEHILLLGKAYEWCNGASMLIIVQAVSVVGLLWQHPLALPGLIISTLLCVVCSIWIGKYFAEILKLNPFPYMVIAALATFVPILGSLIIIGGCAFWIFFLLLKHKVKIGFENWTMMNYKSRVKELQSQGL